MKKMRKFFTAVLVSIGVLGLSVTAEAEGASYHIDEAGMDVEIPDEYVVFTRDMDEEDASLLGYSYDDIMSIFEGTNLYLAAVDGLKEIDIQVSESSIEDLNLINDETVLEIFSQKANSLGDENVTLLEYEIYQHEQAKFIKMKYLYNGSYTIRYGTTYNWKMIYFDFSIYSSSESDIEYEELAETIVDSVYFDDDLLTNEVVQSQDSTQQETSQEFTYIDEDTGATFVIPENWEQDQFYSETEYLKAKFVSTQNESLLITYGSHDYWNELSESNKQTCKRSDYNNGLFTDDDIKNIGEQMMDNPQISKVSYNGYEYFQIVGESTQNVYGTEYTSPMTCLMYFNEGWGYSFYYCVTPEDEYFSDFEEIMNTVTYPGMVTSADETVESLESVEPLELDESILEDWDPAADIEAELNGTYESASEQTEAVVSESGGSNVGYYVMIAIIAVAIGAVVVVIAIFVIKAMQKSKDKKRNVAAQRMMYGNQSGASQQAPDIYQHNIAQMTPYGYQQNMQQKSSYGYQLNAEQQPSYGYQTDPTQPVQSENQPGDVSQMQQKLRYCAACGTQLRTGSMYCPKCGTRAM